MLQRRRARRIETCLSNAAKTVSAIRRPPGFRMFFGVVVVNNQSNHRPVTTIFRFPMVKAKRCLYFFQIILPTCCLSTVVRSVYVKYNIIRNYDVSCLCVKSTIKIKPQKQLYTFVCIYSVATSITKR